MYKADSELRRQLRLLHIEAEGMDLDRLIRLLEELIRWNRRVNLTAIDTWEEGVEKHLVDSLTLLPLLSGDEKILDLGSGGGFPGLPLKIACSGIQVTSVDAVAKKISFQRHILRTFGLEGFDAIHERAENLPRYPGFSGGFDVVVSRAFASLIHFATLALPCLAPAGRLLAMKGAGGEEELSVSAEELNRLGLHCSELRKLKLPVSGARRTLLVLERGHPLPT